MPNFKSPPIIEEYFKKRIKSSLREFKDINDLNEVINQIIDFKYSHVCKGLSKNAIASKWQYNTLRFGEKLQKKEIMNVRLIKIASQNLNDPLIYPIYKKDLINFPDFYFLYKFLELSYCSSLGRRLKKIDLKKLYFCRIDEIIIQNMNYFDEIENYEIFEIDEEFFIKLKSLKWETKNTETFFLKLNNAKTDIIYDLSEFSDDEYLSSRDSPSGHNPYAPSRLIPTFPPLTKKAFLSYTIIPIGSRSVNPINLVAIFFMAYDNPYLNFPATENTFILFLAGCSAVNDGHSEIDENDVIKAYKTYYKLLTTDISKLVDKLWEAKSENENNGYLVCQKCNSYYKLQPGEAPEDFDSKCECGGELEYSENIDWLFKNES